MIEEISFEINKNKWNKMLKTMNGTELSVNQSQCVVSFFSFVRIRLLSDGGDGVGGAGMC